jgi:Fe-S oxidoreductase
MLDRLNPDAAAQDHLFLQETVLDGCTQCKTCVNACLFLQHNDTPGNIALAALAQSNSIQLNGNRIDPFQCSLCGLCDAVCPQHLPITQMILNLRRQKVQCGNHPAGDHNTLLTYENRGLSKPFTFYYLPEQCDTVFFPGCGLSGTRPRVTESSWDYIRKTIDHAGIILDCCSKPSHDLGRQDQFEAQFSDLKHYLLDHRIKTIIVACPSCLDMFKNHLPQVQVKTIYEILVENNSLRQQIKGTVEVHDPCQARFEPSVHQSVRDLVTLSGLTICNRDTDSGKTHCCGEGGSVSHYAPEYARDWTEKTTGSKAQAPLVSYCTGCVDRFSKKRKTIHLLDLLFTPEKAMAGKARVSQSPFTYFNRIRLKRSLKKKVSGGYLDCIRSSKFDKVPG